MTVKVAIAQMNSTVGDLAGNRAKIVDLARRAHAAGADIVLTPELSLVGYPPEDLLLRSAFYAKTQQTFAALAQDLAQFPDLHVVVGLPLQDDAGLVRHNAASVLVNGQVLGTYRKHDLPNTTVFDETGRPVSRATKADVFTQDIFNGIKDDGFYYYSLNQFPSPFSPHWWPSFSAGGDRRMVNQQLG